MSLEQAGTPSAGSRLLVIDAAMAGPDAEILVAMVAASGDMPPDAVRTALGRGASDRIAVMAREVLLACAPCRPDGIVVVNGPGSFTGLRASLALAHGLAAGFGIPVHGVGTGRAHAAMAGITGAWACLSVARRGRLFCEREDGAISAIDLPQDGPTDNGPIGDDPIDRQDWPAGTTILGDARTRVPAPLARRRGWTIGALTRPDASSIARVALMHGGRAMPVYVDPPEARPPAAGLRPFPV